MRKGLRYLALLLIAALLFPAAGIAEGTEVEARLNQAQAFRAEGKTEEALIALELAMKIDPAALAPQRAALDILMEDQRYDDARQALNQALEHNPTSPELHLYSARIEDALSNLDGAWNALLTSRVAAGSDAAFSELLDEASGSWLITFADQLVSARRYAEAMQLYEIRTPEPGQDEGYQRAQDRLSTTGPVIDIHPGITEEEYNQALLEDRLALKPVSPSITLDIEAFRDEIIRYNEAMAAYGLDGVMDPDDLDDATESTMLIEGEEFYQSTQILSISPDGETMLLNLSTALALVDLPTGAFRLIAPAAGMDPEYVEDSLPMVLDRIELGSISWSAKGDYIALAFPVRSLMYMELDCNILLIDVYEATVTTVVDMPAGVSLWDETFEGAPFKAGFDPAQDLLYYEMYGSIETEEYERFNELRVFDPATGSHETVGQVDSAETTLDPKLWVTDAGIYRGYSHTRDGDAGIANFAFEAGESRYPMRESIVPYFRSVRLIDQRGDSALFTAQLTYSQDEEDEGDAPDVMSIQRLLIPVRLEELSGESFDATLALAPAEDAQSRLAWIDMKDCPELDEAAMASIQMDEMVLPYGAALSPDGRYLLLSAPQWEDDVSPIGLYLLDLESGVCGKIDLSGLEGASLTEVAATIQNNVGMLWISGDEILLMVDGEHRLYELTVT